MNKLTTTLAGLAFVAAASVAPAFAQGNFFTPGPFQFTFIGTQGTAGSSFLVNAIPVTFNTLDASGIKTGLLTLSGGQELGSGPLYTGTMLSFVPNGGGPVVTDTFNFVALANTNTSQGYGIANFGVGNNGSTFNLIQGTPAAVPEASTVLSFGALLALGGLAVLRKKTAVKNAA